jgi:hypothetical protein
MRADPFGDGKMRRSLLIFGLLLSACASPAPVTTTALVAADAATSLAVGERISQETSSQPAQQEGMDPANSLTLRHADGRSLSFQEANHTPNDIFVQSAGGALAQIMGLPGEETTTLYYAASGEGAGSTEGAFFCGPQGPAAIGTYEARDGTLQVVGLRQAIQVETRPDGQTEAVPYSPDQVCARLKFRRG